MSIRNFHRFRFCCLVTLKRGIDQLSKDFSYKIKLKFSISTYYRRNKTKPWTIRIGLIHNTGKSYQSKCSIIDEINFSKKKIDHELEFPAI